MTSRGLCIVIFCVFAATRSSPVTGYENVGRMVRGHLGTLYNLRNKLSSSVTPTAASVTSPPLATPVRKESRGYAFHYSPSEVSNPIYPSSSQQFASRMGKIDEEPVASVKVKSSAKNWNKLAKYNTKLAKEKDSSVNSFNLHQSSEKEPITSSVVAAEPSTSTTTTSAPTTPGLSPIQTIGQGLNTAMTQILTQKLMGMLDQDIPQGLFTPLKHLVASGNKMIEFWDKRAIARDGKTAGIVEVLGYGLEQLKNFRDGQAIKPSDPVANLTSPSKTLIQGMLTVKKLTNRVLGYDTSNEVAESRGGYGHDSYGHGGGYGQYVSYGHYLDPYAILATLGFGVFLFNVIFNLLNNNAAASGRSLDVSDLDIPLALSDVIGSSNAEDKIFGTPTVRNRRDVSDGDADEGSMFYSAVEKLDKMYSAYKEISQKPQCARLYLCRLAVDDAYSDESSVLSPLYMYGLGHLAKDKTASDFVTEVKTRVTNGETVDCDKLVKGCSHKQKPKRKLP